MFFTCNVVENIFKNQLLMYILWFGTKMQKCYLMRLIYPQSRHLILTRLSRSYWDECGMSVWVSWQHPNWAAQRQIRMEASNERLWQVHDQFPFETHLPQRCCFFHTGGANSMLEMTKKREKRELFWRPCKPSEYQGNEVGINYLLGISIPQNCLLKGSQGS